MQAIDSTIAFCQAYQSDLVILWTNDPTLNAPFERLFFPIQAQDITVNVVEFPAGFLERHLVHRSFIPKGRLHQLKKLARSIQLKTDKSVQADLLQKINAIPSDKVILNKELSDLLDALRAVPHKSIQELDELFYPKAGDRLAAVVSKKTDSIYLESCYKISPEHRLKEHFVPREALQDQINQVVSTFDQTMGVHVRRTDHKAAMRVSTSERFFQEIQQAIDQQKASSFFLCTDDDTVKQEFVSAFGDKIIVSSIAQYDRNKTDAIEGAVIDLYCLSKTKAILGSYQSSFSKTAASIGAIELKIAGASN